MNKMMVCFFAFIVIQIATIKNYELKKRFKSPSQGFKYKSFAFEGE